MPDNPTTNQPTPAPKGKPPVKREPAFWKGLLEQGELILRLMGDRRVPILAKLLPLGAAAYLLAPDLVPGPIDDAGAIWIGTQLFIQLSPDWVVDEHLDAIDRRAWERERKKTNRRAGQPQPQPTSSKPESESSPSTPTKTPEVEDDQIRLVVVDRPEGIVVLHLKMAVVQWIMNNRALWKELKALDVSLDGQILSFPAEKEGEVLVALTRRIENLRFVSSNYFKDRHRKAK